MSTARFFPCPWQHVYCDVVHCTGLVKWYIGLPDGPEGENYKLCDSCAKALVGEAPEELVPEKTKSLMWQETAEIPLKRKGKPAKSSDEE